VGLQWHCFDEHVGDLITVLAHVRDLALREPQLGGCDSDEHPKEDPGQDLIHAKKNRTRLRDPTTASIA
jgi:hypothetical protein